MTIPDPPVYPMATSVDRQKSRSGLMGSRWLLLVVYPIGFWLTHSTYSHELSYLWLTGLAMFSCALLLTMMGRAPAITLPIWVILFIFGIGYYVKFYWFTIVLQRNYEWPFPLIFYAPANLPDVMLEAYRITTLGFVAFCVTSWISIGISTGNTHTTSKHVADAVIREPSASAIRVFLVLIVLSMIFTAYLQYATGIGIAGTAMIYLPFRLAGVIVHFRTIFLPTALIIIIYLARIWKRQRILTISFTLLLLHGLTQMVLQSSRGVLLNMITPLFFLWLLSARKNNRLLWGLAFVLVAVMWLHPLISGYRDIRLSGDRRDIVNSLLAAARDASEQGNTFVAGATSVVARITGVDALLFAVQFQNVPFTLGNVSYYLFNGERSLTRIYTQDVVGLGPNVLNHLSAPSLVGAFHLLGGGTAVFIGTALWTALWLAGWRALNRLHWHILPVVQSTFLLVLLNLTMEGDIENVFFRGFMYLASLALCEYIIRRFIIRRYIGMNV